MIKKKDSTYAPLSLYFIIDNQLIDEQLKIKAQTKLSEEIINYSWNF